MVSRLLSIAAQVSCCPVNSVSERLLHLNWCLLNLAEFCLKPVHAVGGNGACCWPVRIECRMTRVPITFLAIALVLAVMSARDYLNNKKNFTIRGRILLRMALIFAAVICYLFWNCHTRGQ